MSNSDNSDAQDLQAVPTWRQLCLTDISCPLCLYDLTRNPIPKCPECGYDLIDEDIKLGERRRAFLELTKAAPVVRHVIAALIMTAVVPYVGFFIAIPPMLSVLFLSVGKGRGLVPRLRRRVWLMSAFWLHLPWMMIGCASPIYDYVYWNHLYGTNYPERASEWPDETQFVGVVLAFLAGYVVWRRSLRRLIRISSLMENDPVMRWKSAATRVALLSLGLACLLLVIPVMLWIMDTFWPGWA